MERNRLSRRQYAVSAAAGLTALIAGCISDDNSDEEVADENDDDTDGDEEASESDGETDELDEEESEEDPVGSITVVLENEDNDPISSGVEVSLDPANDIVTYRFGDSDVEDGEHTVTVDEQDEYTVTAESPEDEFEPAEEEVTLGEEDETVTLTLDGATAD